MSGTPVPIPPAPASPTILLPPPNSFPPSVSNVLDAVKYRHDVKKNLESNCTATRCTAQDYYNAIIYEHRVVEQASGTGPAWFEAAFFETEAAIGLIRNDINDLRSKLNKDVIPPLKRTENARRRSGPYEVIPFIDGTDPTLAPNHLPPLTSTERIDTLTSLVVSQYLNGYGVNVPDIASNEVKRSLLKQAIGIEWS